MTLPQVLHGWLLLFIQDFAELELSSQHSLSFLLVIFFKELVSILNYLFTYLHGLS